MARGAASSFLAASVLLFCPGVVAPPAPKRHVVIAARAPPEGVVNIVRVNASHGSAHAKAGLGKMLDEILVLRGELHTTRTSNGDAETESLDKQLEELARMLDDLQAQEQGQHRENVDSHSDMQAAIDRLREQVRLIEKGNSGTGGDGSSTEGSSSNSGDNGDDPQAAGSIGSVDGTSVDGTNGTSAEHGTGSDGDASDHGASPETSVGGHSNVPSAGVVDREGPSSAGEGPPSMESDENAPSASASSADRADQVDVDMAMPYGDLAPFGREDTAQELTEESIRQSNAMVDQIERAEVSEEKRSVFRALTRLRGAAITSYDGVARSQTGNIDDYARSNQWRIAHPVHHLADDEADVSKWAFPDNDS